MKTFTITTNGTTRTVEGKRIGNEFRIYNIYGSIAEDSEVAEMAQELFCILKAQGINRVSMNSH